MSALLTWEGIRESEESKLILYFLNYSYNNYRYIVLKDKAHTCIGFIVCTYVAASKAL